MSVASLPFLFDSPIGTTHAWYRGMQELGASIDAEDLTLHGNLGMEHRIADARRPDLINDIQKEITASTAPHLRTALQKHFRSRYVKPPASVRFMGALVSLPSDTVLIHVTSLGGLFKRLFGNPSVAEILRDALDLCLGISRLLPIDKASWQPGHTESLARALNMCDASEFAAFFNVVHDQISSSTPCWWAALEVELKKQTDKLQNAHHMVHALGLGSFEPDEYLLVYRYRLRDAGLLYQPTVVESNAYAYHFPNPPVLKPQGGLSMPLTSGLLPCSEFLHHPLSSSRATAALQRPALSLSHLPPTGSVLAQIKALRDAHRRQLQRSHNMNAQNVAWLNRHKQAF